MVHLLYSIITLHFEINFHRNLNELITKMIGDHLTICDDSSEYLDHIQNGLIISICENRAREICLCVMNTKHVCTFLKYYFKNLE